jgi:hypothetical protein
MQPPKCRLCGVAEWQHVCSGGAEPPRQHHGFTGSAVTRQRNKIVTTSVTPAAAVTSGVTPCAECKRLRRALKEAAAEIEALHGEVAQLKRAAAGHGARPAAVPAAERMRRMRAKRKEQQHV